MGNNRHFNTDGEFQTKYGWGDYDGLKLVKLPYSEKIKTWNTKEK